MAADLFYKSVPGLCLIISRAARYLPKLALNNIPSLCVYYDLYEVNVARKEYKSRSDQSDWIQTSQIGGQPYIEISPLQSN